MNSDDRSKLIDEVLALRASKEALQKRVEELEAGLQLVKAKLFQIQGTENGQLAHTIITINGLLTK